VIRAVRDVLMERFRTEVELAAPPSPSGKQLEQMRCGTGSDDSRLYYRSQVADRLKIQHADAVLLSRDLTPLEVEVCRLRYWFVEAHETYQRNVTDDDLHPIRDEEEPWIPPTIATHGGERKVHAAVDANGQRVDGRSVVRGTRARLTSFETIGRVLDLSPRQVRRLLEFAHDKIRRRILAAAEQSA